ncbi:SulP family inorganic anion transporter [Candidatus Thioglobus sp.]|uniref:SulP family inorganic anion transporter n=1 Tax=Candidatus Thioglobus sp. TaxID=2026721 RepID=UPI003D10A57C
MRIKASLLQAWLPFLRWFPMTQETVRADIIAGITVALLLVPQSMAYAQLAGLPVVYGLYASIVPVIIASMWGSCSQLHTAPVAMLSMMSAAALIPFAVMGTEKFIELAIMLGLMVGVLRMTLGLARLGFLVNFISNPVLVGFTNAAALIIGLSQLNKIIGVPFPRTDAYVADLWNVLLQIGETHWLTLAFAVGAYTIIRISDRYIKRLPGVLMAVVIATAVSAFVGFEKKETVALEAIQAGAQSELIRNYIETKATMGAMTSNIANNNNAIHQLNQQAGQNLQIAELEGEILTTQLKLRTLKKQNNQRQVDLNRVAFVRVLADGGANYYERDQLPDGMTADVHNWRLASVANGQAIFSAGGAVVGSIPKGLPSFSVPVIDFSIMLMLLPAAFIMALIGFLEATSISRAIAIRTKQKTDVNKELVGQGLANIAGSFFSSFTVSGSFSRSAVASKIGACTGLFSIISALAVVVVLLFLTPLLYHLPQAVLAVIVMMAVFGLVRVQPLIHAWRVDRASAIIGMVAFVATLAMAPAIANGIMVGIVLTMVAFVLRVMKPRSEVLGLGSDGILTGIKAHNLAPVSQSFVPIRFDGAIMFANVAYLERAISEARSDFPEARTILIVGGGINWIDASGEEKIREMAVSLHNIGITLTFSSLKQQVRNSFECSGLDTLIGEGNIFHSKGEALTALTKHYENTSNKE